MPRENTPFSIVPHLEMRCDFARAIGFPKFPSGESEAVRDKYIISGGLPKNEPEPLPSTPPLAPQRHGLPYSLPVFMIYMLYDH